MLLFLLKLVFLPYLCVAVTVEILTDPVTNEGQYSYVAGESNLTLKCRTYLGDWDCGSECCMRLAVSHV